MEKTHFIIRAVQKNSFLLFQQFAAYLPVKIDKNASLLVICLLVVHIYIYKYIVLMLFYMVVGF